MAEVKGKFITLTGILMYDKPDILRQADIYLEEQIGLKHTELSPEEFYDTNIWDEYMRIYANSFTDPVQAVIDLGTRVYPTIKRTAGMPPNLKTPLDYVKFEAEGFLQNHCGDDVIPRKILYEKDNEIIMYAPAPGYNENLYIGVWLGILEMIGVNTGRVERISDHTYRIIW